MKNKGLIIILISIISLLIISLITLICVLINNKQAFNFNLGFSTKTINNLQINKQYEEYIKEINIVSTTADIKIKKSEDNIIKLKTYSKEGYSKEKVNNNTLTITVENEQCKYFCINKKISKIELYIPKDYENKINIKNKYGDITIDSFENLNIDIEESAGDIKIDDANITNIKSKYGDIKIKNINKANITSSAGDIKIDNIYEYIDIKANSGDIKINNLNIIEDSSIKNDYGDIEIKKTNAHIDAKVKLGDLEINNNQSDVTLKITNNCGDVEVN